MDAFSVWIWRSHWLFSLTKPLEWSKLMRMALESHHKSLMLNYMRFVRYLRSQCLRSISSVFTDNEVRVNDATYSLEEVRELINGLSNEVNLEVESELINVAHTNVLLLQQLFTQAEKWHLELDVDLAELENRELLDKVKQWEESELSSHSLDEKPSLLTTKRLKPMSEGPLESLQKEMDRLRLENEKLTKIQAEKEKKADIEGAKDDSRMEKLSSELAMTKETLTLSQSKSEETASLLKSDLTNTKAALDDLKKQLSMAEKELERKFSETGAYRNMKKMLTTKNEQLKELRLRLTKYESEDKSNTNLDDDDE